MKKTWKIKERKKEREKGGRKIRQHEGLLKPLGWQDDITHMYSYPYPSLKAWSKTVYSKNY